MSGEGGAIAEVLHCEWCGAAPSQPCQEWGEPIGRLHDGPSGRLTAAAALLASPALADLLARERQRGREEARARTSTLLAKYAGRSKWVGFEPARREAWAEIERDLRAALADVPAAAEGER